MRIERAVVILVALLRCRAFNHSPSGRISNPRHRNHCCITRLSLIASESEMEAVVDPIERRGLDAKARDDISDRSRNAGLYWTGDFEGEGRGEEQDMRSLEYLVRATLIGASTGGAIVFLKKAIELFQVFLYDDLASALPKPEFYWPIVLYVNDGLCLGGYSCLMLLSYCIITSALESSDPLLSYPTTILSLHKTIILIITLK